ncbi:hypothetical protein K440DRAFT_621912 [Wilcoxina mikolae CBS 423.85]|nr:hypothetical protein K440DRAFT_621912 [Wilcoxina mikolae CBS 423.85]
MNTRSHSSSPLWPPRPRRFSPSPFAIPPSPSSLSSPSPSPYARRFPPHVWQAYSVEACSGREAIVVLSNLTLCTSAQSGEVIGRFRQEQGQRRESEIAMRPRSRMTSGKPPPGF